MKRERESIRKRERKRDKLTKKDKKLEILQTNSILRSTTTTTTTTNNCLTI